MLVLTRKSRECVVIGGAPWFEQLIKITVLDIGAGKVRLGFEVDAEIPVHRFEVWERIRASEQPKGRSGPLVAPTKEGSDRWDDDGGWPQAPSEEAAVGKP
jgi:carbon storage regulator